MMLLNCSMLRTPSEASMRIRRSISATAHFSTLAATLASVTTGVSRCGMSS
jgi:hypothetical protein